MCSLLGSRVQAYVDLTKPKIVFLLDFTALMAFLVATRSINVFSLAVVLVAGTLASAGAGGRYLFLDKDIDDNTGLKKHKTLPSSARATVKAPILLLGMV